MALIGAESQPLLTSLNKLTESVEQTVVCDYSEDITLFVSISDSVESVEHSVTLIKVYGVACYQ